MQIDGLASYAAFRRPRPRCSRSLGNRRVLRVLAKTESLGANDGDEGRPGFMQNELQRT